MKVLSKLVLAAVIACFLLPMLAGDTAEAGKRRYYKHPAVKRHVKHHYRGVHYGHTGVRVVAPGVGVHVGPAPRVHVHAYPGVRVHVAPRHHGFYYGW
jgi:hypothetical protein